MKFGKLPRSYESRPWPRCQAEVADALKVWRDRVGPPHGGEGYNCSRWAQYQVGKKVYCQLHAGQLALKELIQ